MLLIKNLSVTVREQQIIKNCSLAVAPGTLHVLMGPNGSGKSSLANTLMGHPQYTVVDGSITLNNIDITQLSVDKRARHGLFLALQYPCEIPGLTLFNFLKEAYYALCGVIEVHEFQTRLYAIMDLLSIDHAFAYRHVNEGFSGGEKKRCELLQMMLLEPQVAIIDEIDSGLDVDALKVVAHGIAKARKHNPQLAILLITHYQRILHYITPDAVHVMHGGTIVCSGDMQLVYEVERQGYEKLLQNAPGS
jgi:Fe-S cluster assembly ATP-binding protein